MSRFAKTILIAAFLSLFAIQHREVAYGHGAAGLRINPRTTTPDPAFTSAYTSGLTSTGQRLWVQVVASGGSSSGFSLMVNLKSGKDPYAAPFELHQWSFDLNGRSLAYSPKSGVGALNVGSQIQPFGTISLHLQRTATVQTSCGRGRGTSKMDTLRVAGIMAFDTHTSAWGTMGRPGHSFSFATGSSITYQTCPGAQNAPSQCLSGHLWSSPGTFVYRKGKLVGALHFDGGVMPGAAEPGSPAGHPWQGIVAVRHIGLPRPTGAGRLDEVIEAEPSPTVLGRMLKVRTTNKALISGGAEITSAGKEQNLGTQTCTLNGKTHHQQTSGYLSGSWRNLKKQPLVGHLAAEGNIRVKDGSGTIVYTLSFR